MQFFLEINLLSKLYVHMKLFSSSVKDYKVIFQNDKFYFMMYSEKLFYSNFFFIREITHLV